jgi:hypothetical protein
MPGRLKPGLGLLVACETMDAMPLTKDQLAELKKQLDASELLHHRIMAKMGDAGFDLLEAWERKERLDGEIGRFIRAATTA